MSAADVAISPARVVSPSGTVQSVKDMDDAAWSSAVKGAMSSHFRDEALIAMITAISLVAVAAGIMYIRRRRLRRKQKKVANAGVTGADPLASQVMISLFFWLCFAGDADSVCSRSALQPLYRQEDHR